MKLKLDYDIAPFQRAELKVVGSFEVLSSTSKGSKKSPKSTKSNFSSDWSQKDLAANFKSTKESQSFKAQAGSTVSFNAQTGDSVLVVGLGKKDKFSNENLRRSIAKAFKQFQAKDFATVSIDVQSFDALENTALTSSLICESLHMSAYKFDKYLSQKSSPAFKHISLYVADKSQKRSIDSAVKKTLNVTSSISLCRDYINEPPNTLNSVEYAKRIEKDVKTHLKNVKVKILGKQELKKEKMNLFLSVNAGSAYDPRLVHLTYTPKKVTKKTKHYALVGKGLTFDTGGYSLKPGKSMMGMKFDMGGSATVYGAFRAAALNNSPHKITCILGITDNAVNSKATFPDSIVKARNGMSVEILNTDAEGRLVLADCLDYACDQKPNFIIDAATLTGACLVALGSQVCAVLGNNDDFIADVKENAKDQDEYIWQLPIIDEWKDDMKSKIADLKNIGTPMMAGTATAAAFLGNFIKNDISWAHLDVAGVAGDQSHLPYCPPKGASGIMVRSLHKLLTSE